VSESVLSRTAARAFRLLVSLARTPRLLFAMRKRGFTLEEQARGWAYIDAVAGRGEVTAPEAELDESVETAIERVDHWVTVNLPVMKAALRYRHGAQYEFLFNGGVGVAHGADAVRVAATLMVRLDAMEKSPERESTRADDRAALQTLVARGVTADDRQQVAARILLIQRAGAEAEETEAAVKRSLPPAANDPRVALYMWFSEWSEIARAVIARRADLIKLGLASPRRGRAADEEVAEEDEAEDEGESIEARESDADTDAEAEPVKAEPVKVAAVKPAPARVAAPKVPAARATAAKPRGTPSSAPSPV